MPTITFDLPEGALSALRLSPTEFVKKMRVAAALLWYSHGEISQSKAAEIAGTSRAFVRRREKEKDDGPCDSSMA